MRRLLYAIGYHAVLAIAILLSPFVPKIRRGLAGRRGLLARARQAASGFSAERPYWFHIASSGELEQALPILDALRAKEPSVPLVLTYFSPTAERALELEKRRRENTGTAVPWDWADFSPFDRRGSVAEFLSVIAPRAFVAIHREIWPECLLACRERAIPTFLFAAYVPREAQRWMRLYRPWLGCFTGIGTTDERSAERLAEALTAAAAPPRPLGDPRVERVLARKQRQVAAPWAESLLGRPTLVLASLWPEDVEAIRPGLERLLLSHPQLRIVAVPHEPKRPFVAELLGFFRSRGVPARRWSEWIARPANDGALVVDGVGFLAELYRTASVVFVGGSFRGRVHNCLEPAAYGKPILTGPFLWNSGEALAMKAAGLLVPIDGGPAFAHEVARLLDDGPLADERGRGLVGFLEARRGAGERYAELLTTTHAARRVDIDRQDF